MIKNIRKNEIHSVLNTDAYDKRRFGQIFDMSKGIQDLLNDNEIPLFKDLLNDIWASLYKVDPTLKEHDDIPSELQMNEALLTKMMSDESFENYRDLTKLDDLSSAIGTIKFGEQIKEWINEEKEHNQQLKQQMDQVQKMLNQLQKSGDDNGSNDGAEGKQQGLEQAMQNLASQMKNALDANGNSFLQKLEQAMQETKDTEENLKSLFNGMESGSGEAELKKVPLRDQISLAEKLSNNDHVKEIAKWAGRFKQIARQKQKSKSKDSVKRSGVTVGNEIEQLLPTELANYVNPKTKQEFLRKFAEGEALEYNRKSKESLGKGPIILCLDQSGSMRNLDTQSKGFSLALMSIAKKQKRDFCLILFSTRIKTMEYKKGKTKIDNMIQLAETFLSGGTEFQLPLTEALNVITKSRFNKSDIIFVTDGQDTLSESFIGEFNDCKQKKGVSVLSLVIKGQTQTVESFSDRVIQINNFNEEGSYTAFEI